MEKIDFAKLRKMPPERRVAALREVHEELTKLIKERSKEIEERNQEINDAQEFLKEAEDELRVLEEMQSTAPELKRVDVEKLFEREETRTTPARPRERELESIAEEAPRKPSAQEQQVYVNFLAHQPVTGLYDRINQIREDITTTGVISMYQQDKLNQFREALHQKEEDVKTGAYEPGRNAERLISAAEDSIQYATRTKTSFYRTRHDNQ